MNEDELKQAMAMIPGSRRAANGIIVQIDSTALYITSIRSRDMDLAPEEEIFLTFCSKHEILRLRQIKSPHDYLLRLRAIAIADSPRMVRVMAVRRAKFEKNSRTWSLTGYYHSLNLVPRRYIDSLNRHHRKLCRTVPFGFVPIKEANAICIKSITGDLVVASESLRYFYYFMTIYLHGESYDVEINDRLLAGIIGLRIMIGSEALDFDIDPRGFLSKRTEAALNQHVDAMIEFTFGHEYAHMLLNHIPSSENLDSSNQDADIKIYTDKIEPEADFHAIKFAGNDPNKTALLIHAACDVLLYLHAVELISIEQSCVPRFSVSKTHPAPLSRLRTLCESLGSRRQPEPQKLERSINSIHEMSDILLQCIASSDEEGLLTRYGSIYLTGLGGYARRDRIDY